MPGSSHPKLVGDWLADFDSAASMDDLDHSGFTVDSNQTEFETLDSRTVEGIAKIIRAGQEALQRKSDDAHELADYVSVLPTLRYQQKNKDGQWDKRTCSTLNCTTTTSSSSTKLGQKCLCPWTEELMKRCSQICTKGKSKDLRL